VNCRVTVDVDRQQHSLCLHRECYTRVWLIVKLCRYYRPLQELRNSDCTFAGPQVVQCIVAFDDVLFNKTDDEDAFRDFGSSWRVVTIEVFIYSSMVVTARAPK
jgi:hypothetical protein